MGQQSNQLLADALIDIRSLLLKCGPVNRHSQLRAVFIDPRIRAWRDQLPERTNQEERVEAIIDLLWEEYDASANNALVLFLQVLSERADSRTACQGQLQRMMVRLHPLVGSVIASEQLGKVSDKTISTYIDNRRTETHFHGSVEGTIHSGQGDVNQQDMKNEADDLRRPD